MPFRRHACIAALLLGTIARGVHAQSGTVRDAPGREGDELLGLWGAEPRLGPQVTGDLTLARSGQTWTLRVAGFEVTALQRGDSVVIALPGGQGTMRLWTRARGAPDAYWVQPPGLGSSYASPVTLRAAGADAWRGTATPVEAQFPLYLMVSRAADGTLRGTFRNPAVNWPGQVPAYLVRRTADQVEFTNPRTGKVQWVQPFDAERRTITFDFGAPIVLMPRTLEQAAGFVPRSPSLPRYRYREPPIVDDAWRVAHAAAAGVDAGALETIVRDLVAVDPLSETAPRVHALVVARHGRLVLDEYFRGHDAAMPHDLRSASKTMTSILAGAAMQRGAPLTAATPAGRPGMTLAHLLSHTTGLACNDEEDASPGNEDTMQSQHAGEDWYTFFLALPRVTDPGTTYSYCSAGVNMAGGVIGGVTHRWLPRLFETSLARPMQFGAYGINLMPNGEAYAGGGTHLRPRDLLKFGQLFLNGGVWNGTRLVPAAWVRTSTARVIDRSDGSSDGLGWHRHTLQVNGRAVETYEASGNGGQFLLVAPSLDVAIVVTAGNYGQYNVWKAIREVLMPRVLAAVQ